MLTNGATFEITGIQLEVGSVATTFDHKSYAQDLALCQRYYYKHAADVDHTAVGVGTSYTSSIHIGIIDFPVQMRTRPTMDSPTGTDYYRVVANNTTKNQSNCALEDTNTNCCGFRFYGGSTATQGHGFYGRLGNTSAYVAFTAEL